jgi:quinone-modifying oxidoreductase subunit QmoA
MTETTAPASGSIMVVGGGISGLTTATRSGRSRVRRVPGGERIPTWVDGWHSSISISRSCARPPADLEINFRRIKDNPRIKVLTLAEVEKVDGTAGQLRCRGYGQATLRQ